MPIATSYIFALHVDGTAETQVHGLTNTLSRPGCNSLSLPTVIRICCCQEAHKS